MENTFSNYINYKEDIYKYIYVYNNYNTEL